MKKVILTGNTGLIGKEAIKPLKEAGFEVFELDIKNCDLLNKNDVKNFISKIKPSHLLHFAWITGGDYLTNPINTDLMEASLNLLEEFKNNGGKRAVFAGTCFEYAFKNEPVKESDPLNPQTLYAKCKNDLHMEAEKISEISFAWGRIFYVFGKNEKEGRLTSTIINNFKKGMPVTITTGGLIRDYMYTKDIACAFVELLKSEVEGSVNICMGKGISLADYAMKFAKKMKCENLLIVKEEETSAPPIIIGDNTRLMKEVGFMPKYSIDEAIDEILSPN